MLSILSHFVHVARLSPSPLEECAPSWEVGISSGRTSSRQRPPSWKICFFPAFLYWQQGYRRHSPRTKESYSMCSASPCLARVEVSLRISGNYPRGLGRKPRLSGRKVASWFGVRTCLFSHPCDDGKGSTMAPSHGRCRKTQVPTLPAILKHHPFCWWEPEGAAFFPDGGEMQTTEQLDSHQVVNIKYGGFHRTSYFPRWLNQMRRQNAGRGWHGLSRQQGQGPEQKGSPGSPGQHQPPPAHHIPPSISGMDARCTAARPSRLVGGRAERSTIRSLCGLWDILCGCLLIYEESLIG